VALAGAVAAQAEQRTAQPAPPPCECHNTSTTRYLFLGLMYEKNGITRYQILSSCRDDCGTGYCKHWRQKAQCKDCTANRQQRQYTIEK
jgi:hypothetical protein